MSDEKIPDLIKIFEIKTPRELKRFCRSATISRDDLARVIMWCHSDKAIFSHVANHRDFIPPHLGLSEADVQALATNGVGNLNPDAQKAVNKMGAMFDERRLLSGHLFQGLSGWHLLYFDNRDRNPRDNHWIEGPHIHLINHVLAKQTSNSVWRKFCDGNPKMTGALHIRMPED